MKRWMLALILLSVLFYAHAARKALVIGNASYQSSPLRNPVNDVNLVADKLQKLGFAVTKVTNADQRSMDQALNSFAAGLTGSDEAVFYYSGHGANVDGINYLIPVGREINYEEDLPYFAFNCNHAMDLLQRARITVAVLDACRDNPFRGVRSGSKGLANMQGKAGSQYIIFATEQGKTAADGSGSHSPFTESFVSYLDEPLKVEDLMKRVTQDVKTRTYSRQIPWTSGNLIEDFYFARATGNVPATQLPEEAQAQTVRNYGWILVSSSQEADVYLDGSFKGRVSAAADLKISGVTVGSHSLEARTSGKSESKNLYVGKNQESAAHFGWTPDNMVLVERGSFQMGSNDGDSDEKPVHPVTVSSFWIGKYEVTQAEWQEVMGSNPSNWKGDRLPVEQVSWYDAVSYCNKRSIQEGLQPCYTISGSTDPANWGAVPTSSNATWNAAICDWSANGYRLPTEAEWEYAARGGKHSKGYKYSGSNDISSVAWYDGNSSAKTHEVGTKTANELGIHDMSGNVWEWCGDRYDKRYYSKSPGSDPVGAGSGSFRVLRGGSWYGNDNYCRVAYRLNGNPVFRGSNLGLRLARAVF